MYDRKQTPTQSKKMPTSRLGSKRLGAYLLEAGLLSPGQIQVADYDRRITGKKFSEIIVDRGWVKQQTIDFLIRRIIVPEQQSLRSAGAFAQPVEPFETVYERRKSKVLHSDREEEVPWTVD